MEYREFLPHGLSPLRLALTLSRRFPLLPSPPLPSPLPAKKKKHRSFPPFSCCLPSSPLSFAPRLIPAKVERVLNSFAFRFSSFLLQLRHSAPVACRALFKIVPIPALIFSVCIPDIYNLYFREILFSHSLHLENDLFPVSLSFPIIRESETFAFFLNFSYCTQFAYDFFPFYVSSRTSISSVQYLVSYCNIVTQRTVTKRKGQRDKERRERGIAWPKSISMALKCPSGLYRMGGDAITPMSTPAENR